MICPWRNKNSNKLLNTLQARLRLSPFRPSTRPSTQVSFLEYSVVLGRRASERSHICRKTTLTYKSSKFALIGWLNKNPSRKAMQIKVYRPKTLTIGCLWGRGRPGCRKICVKTHRWRVRVLRGPKKSRTTHKLICHPHQNNYRIKQSSKTQMNLCRLNRILSMLTSEKVQDSTQRAQ